MKNSIPKAVPSAVQPSGINPVPINKEAQREPYQPMTGSSVNPKVPRTEVEGDPAPQPHFSGGGDNAGNFQAGSKGAPSVPVDGFLFKAQPIDSHYTAPEEGRNPYYKVNNPPTRGMWTRIQNFLNGIATSQDTDNAGWKARHPQQRTSVMRNTLPPHGMGYAPEMSAPRQNTQARHTNRIDPRPIGTDPYGTGVLNTETYGAGQTAGGIGGNNYTPTPGPPSTNSITSPADTSGMPTWG